MAQNNLGTVLRELGRNEEALEAFRAAVALDPALALARANLGQALIEAGQAEEALEHCQEAVRLQPDLAAAHNNLGNAYRDLERWALAHSAYAEALRLSPDWVTPESTPISALPCNATASWPRPSPASAEPSSWHPTTPRCGRYLADAHAADEDYAAAIPCCERIVALKPESGQAHNDLGWALQEDGRLTEAAACYSRALELRPDCVDALLKQGGLHEELGAMAEAEASYRRARAVDLKAPGRWPALATLLRGGLPDADRDAIRSRSTIPRLDDGPRSEPALRSGPSLRRSRRLRRGRGLPGVGQRPGPEPADQAKPGLRPGRAQPFRRSADRRHSRRNCSTAWPAPATRHDSRCSSSACHVPGPRWSNRCWPAIPGSTAPASCGWRVRHSMSIPGVVGRDDGLRAVPGRPRRAGSARAGPASSRRPS